MAKTILGIFDNRNEADGAIDDLHDAGFDAKDISIIMRHNPEGKRVEPSRGTVVADSTVSGAATGGIIGGIAGLLIGIGAIAVPGIGALLIGGPLVAALGLTGAAATTASGAATGILAGGLLGALVGLGLPERDARVYEERVRTGSIVVAVSAGDADAKEARMILEDNNADQVRMLSTTQHTEEAYEEEPGESARGYSFGVKGGKSKRIND